MHNDAVRHVAVLGQQAAEPVAPCVGQVLRPQQRVAESQPGRNTVFLHQRQNLPRPLLPKSGPAAAPKAVRRSAVDGTYLTPVVEPVPVLPV